MIDKIDITKILFLDIETVSTNARYEDMSETMQSLWHIKSRQITRKKAEELENEEIVNLYGERAGIFAEFGKIVCISVGILIFDADTNDYKLRLKSFADKDEKKLLNSFSELLNNHYSQPQKQYICGHNIKEFDVPYICRRMLIHALPLPNMLELFGKKPWELGHLLDTMVLWRFGDYKNYTSLKLLCGVFGIPSPKGDIDGSEVGKVFWQDDDLDRIAIYCEKDVLATVQLFLKYQRKNLLEDKQVLVISKR